MSPFFANYGFHLHFLAESHTMSLSRHAAPTPEEFAFYLHNIHEHLIQNVKHMQDLQAKYYNAKHKSIALEPGDLVWLNLSNISTMPLSKKLDWKHFSPFKVAKCIGLQAYKLALPASMHHIHDTFHISLLNHFKSTAIPLHGLSTAPPTTYIKDNYQYFEVKDVLDSCRTRNRLEYLIKWKGYLDSDNSWKHSLHVAHSLVKEFHRRNPTKLSSSRC